MTDFVITTENAADLPEEFIQENEIGILSLYYTIDGVTYGPDGERLDVEEFYAKMRAGALPKTQQVNPDQAIQKFRSYLEQGKDILHLALTSAVSGSYNSAKMAAQELMEEYPDRKIVVVDSLNVSLAETILFLKAHQLQEEGRSLSENAAFLEEYRKHINVQFTVDDLFHLKRGGRISGAVAAVGTALNLKPFLSITAEGTLASNGTVRGRKKSIRVLAERMRDTLGDNPDKTVPVGIVHGNCPEDANLAASYVKELTGIDNIIINDVSPSIGTHAGPGALGILYYGKER